MIRLVNVLLAAVIGLSTFVPVYAQAYDHEQRYGGSLVIGTRTKPTSFYTLETNYSISVALASLIFNSLVVDNAEGVIVPQLASNWDISEDGKEYIFYLRKSVDFHDGVELTAYDVKFTFDQIFKNPSTALFKDLVDSVETYDVIDRYKFKISLRQPSSVFLYHLIFDIFPKHVFEGDAISIEEFGRKPVGSGPFKFSSWDNDDVITLAANSDYYAGRPYLDKIIVKPYGDTQQVWSELMRGNVDLSFFLEKDDFKVLEKDSSFKAYTVPAEYYYSVSYNFLDKDWQDERLRRAVAHAVDVDELIDVAVGGYGKKAQGPFYDKLIADVTRVKPYKYNLVAAKRYLRQAGWYDNDSDGVLEQNGRELELRLLVYTPLLVNMRIAMFLRQQLYKVGIKLRVIRYDSPQQLSKEFLKENKAQASLRMVVAGFDIDMLRKQWCMSPSLQDNIFEDYYSKELCELFDEAIEEHDVLKRKHFLQEIQEKLYYHQPVLFLYYPYSFHGISSDFKNTESFFTASMPFYAIKDWYRISKDYKGPYRR